MRNEKHSPSIPIDANAGFCNDPKHGTVATRATANYVCCEPSISVSHNVLGSHGIQESESNEMPYDSLEVLSKRELINFLRRKPCAFDDVDVQCLRDATASRLRVLRARAREGKCVDEASEFSRWVVQSGLLKLFAGRGQAEVKQLVADTSWDCECHWKNDPRGPWVAKSQLEAVNDKLDLLMRGLAASGRISNSGAIVEVSEPERRLIGAGEISPG